MSHFTVLVPANDRDHLEKVLQPYHEYECTGILDEYVTFVPSDMEEAKAKFEEYKKEYDYKSLDEFMKDWYGDEKNSEGVWGRMTNAAKWKWIDANNQEIAITYGNALLPFVREDADSRGKFLLDDERRLVFLLQELYENQQQTAQNTGEKTPLASKSNLQYNAGTVSENVGSSESEMSDLRDEIGVEGRGIRSRPLSHDGNSESDSLRELQLLIRTCKGQCFSTGQVENISSPLRCEFIGGSKWDWWTVGGRWTGSLNLKPEAIGAGLNGDPGLMTEANKDPLRTDSALSSQIDWEGMRQEAVHEAHKTYAQWKIKDTLSNDEKFLLIYGLSNGEDVDLDKMTEEEYVAKWGHADALTFAFIDLQGQWNERGRMGWWGAYSDPENTEVDYGKNWWNFVESLPGDQRVWLVDCHI